MNRARCNFLIYFLGTCTLSSCVSNLLTGTQGIQSEFGAYIPARISVAECQSWPTFASFKNLALSNSTKEENAALAQAVDEFVLSGFDNQPFMQGLSPKLISKLTSEIQPAIILSNGFENWRPRREVCGNCSDVLSYYRESIVNNAPWRVFLGEWSMRTRHSDAVFIPFIVSFYSNTINDRGVIKAFRTAEIAFFLIDTDTGKLIWGRTRRAEVSNKKLQSDPKDISLPGIDVLKSRLLTSDLWIDFPGRVAN